MASFKHLPDSGGKQTKAAICTHLPSRSLSVIFCIICVNSQSFSLSIRELKMAKKHHENILIRTIPEIYDIQANRELIESLESIMYLSVAFDTLVFR